MNPVQGIRLAQTRSTIAAMTGRPRSPFVCWRCMDSKQRADYHSRPFSQTIAEKTRPRSTKPWRHISEKERSNFSTNGAHKSELPSQVESQRSPTSKRVTSFLDTLQSNVFVASKRLNDLTGYTPIETLKDAITTQEAQLSDARTALRDAKEAYQSAITKRSASQREVNGLLQRKNEWTPEDLERFTMLYRNDQANEQAEISANEALAQVEREVEREGEELGKNILRRYHEEQVWSDKIRRMSTWGTWGLMGVNVLLFFVFQIGVEPWRRQRLVKGFEEKVKQAIEQEIHQSPPPVPAASESVPEFKEDVRLADTPAESSSYVSVAVRNVMQRWSLSSMPSILSPEENISMSKVDLTARVLEGAATGAFLSASMVYILLRRS